MLYEDGNSVGENHYILEYTKAKYHDKFPLVLMGHDQVDQRLFARQLARSIILEVRSLINGWYVKEERWMVALRAYVEWIDNKKRYFVSDSFGLLLRSCGHCSWIRSRTPEDQVS